MPQAAPSSPYSPARPLVPTEPIRRGQWEKCRSATADSYSLDASAAFISSTPNNDADEAPGVPAGRRRLDHTTTSDLGPLQPLLQASSTDPSNLHRGRRGRVGMLTGRVTTTSPLPPPLCQFPTTASFVERGIKSGAGYTTIRPMEENAAHPARDPLIDSAAVRRDRLKDSH
jgi:hypothetical protein